MNLLLGAAVCLAVCVVPINSKNTKLTEVFSWRSMDYAWERHGDRQAAIESGEFIPENNLPLGLEVWKNKLFITVPRWKKGVLSTLNYVDIDESKGYHETFHYNKGSYDKPFVVKVKKGRYRPYGYVHDGPVVIESGPSVQTVIFRKNEVSDRENGVIDEVFNVKKRKKIEIVLDEDEDIESGTQKRPKRVHKRRKKKKDSEWEEERDKMEDSEGKKERKKKKKKCKKKPKPSEPPTTDVTESNTEETESTTEATETTDTTMETEPPTTPPPPRSPALIPYPSFAANRIGMSRMGMTPIVSVFRVWADTCDRLWVMDTGVDDILGHRTIIAKPRILIFDLNDDSLIKTYEFRDADVEQHSFFANIVVDVDPEDCKRAHAYVPDLGGYGIVVYDLHNDRSKRMKHNYFHFDPLAGNMKVGGVNFQWTDGVFSIALSKPKGKGERTAYFHALASTKEFAVSTKVLKSSRDSESNFYDYKVLGDRGEDSQSSASYIDPETGIMFYTQLQKDSVNCWNTNKPFKLENLDVVASDNETMIFTNDLKVDREGNLWVLSDRLPTFIYRNLDDTDVNYRIFRATVQDAVAGTKCAP